MPVSSCGAVCNLTNLLEIKPLSAVVSAVQNHVHYLRSHPSWERFWRFRALSSRNYHMLCIPASYRFHQLLLDSTRRHTLEECHVNVRGSDGAVARLAPNDSNCSFGTAWCNWCWLHNLHAASAWPSARPSYLVHSHLKRRHYILNTFIASANRWQWIHSGTPSCSCLGINLAI